MQWEMQLGNAGGKCRRNAVEMQVGHAVEMQVGTAVEMQVGNAVEMQVRNAVGNAGRKCR